MTYDFIKPFEDSWEKIYQEYLNVRDNLVPWPDKQVYNEVGWDTYAIFDFPNGKEVENNNCPFIVSLVKENFPQGQGTVSFSRLKPGTVLVPHRGIKDGKLRAHLGLDIPVGDCNFQVNDNIITWEPGKMFVFDQGEIHAAWNRTDKERVILVIDFFE